MSTEQFFALNSVPEEKTRLTRRQMLHMMAVGAATVGGTTLASCGGGTQTAPKVTLLTAGWPIEAMPTVQTQAKDPVEKAYSHVLKQWMDKNPNVTLKTSNVDIWTSQAVITSIESGTAPSWFGSGLIGNGDSQVRAQMLKGFAADLTELNQSYDVLHKMTSYTQPYFKKTAVQGKYYSVPDDFIISGNCIFYRRDMFQQAGIPEPQTGWTLQDLRTTAKALTKDKVKGLAVPAYGLDWFMADASWDLLTQVPSPNTGWHWKYDYLSNADKWTSMVNLWRDMYFKDQSVLANTGNYDDETPFINGGAAMMVANSGYYTQAPSASDAYLGQVADKMGKTQDEVIGMIAMPVGDNGWFGLNQGILSTVSFDPHLKTAALNSAYDLYMYMYFGDGFKSNAAARYQASKDLRVPYSGSIPTYDYKTIPGVPGTMEDAWGKKWYAEVQKLLAIPVIPQPTWYISPDQTVGPTGDARNNARSTWMFTQNDIIGALKTLNDTMNQQAASFTSSVSASDFTNGAKQYYKALDSFWQTNLPDYHKNVFQPFYTSKVLPALGG